MATVELTSVATALLVKAAVLGARWAGVTRRRALKRLTAGDDVETGVELTYLRERVAQLELQVRILRRHIGKHARSPRYTLAERLHVLWFMEYFQIPKRQVTDVFGISRSTLYRWLRRIDDACPAPRLPANRTPIDVAALVWYIAKTNAHWGRTRIAQQMALLGVFVAASTVRNLLNRPQPPRPKPTRFTASEMPIETVRTIPASFPNHVWSVDLCTVLRWGLWPTHILVAIDHFSSKVVATAPLEGPNAGWVCNAMEAAFEKHGPPRHIISDKGSAFTSAAFTELLRCWSIKHRFGAVGKHGSIAVTERVICTLKYEWLFRVPLIKGIDHLDRLCAEFMEWHNGWRPHTKLGGARPNDWFARDLPEHVPRMAKMAPGKTERRHFAEARVTGFRLPRAA